MAIKGVPAYQKAHIMYVTGMSNQAVSRWANNYY